MKQVIDNFSTGSADYSTFRPESPDAVFEFLYRHVKHFDVAWDCGTGNGQVAVRLAEKFKTVYGTDISQEQLNHAEQRDNIIYRCERAEKTTFDDNCIDLVTVAQAIHWFDFDTFYKEVKRVAKPGGLVAAWTYSLLKLTPAINNVIDHLYYDITYPYWDRERRLVDDGYKTITFPFEELEVPLFEIRKTYTFDQFIGYLRTWSGVKHYVAKEHKDPLLLVIDDLKTAWGDAATAGVWWPVHMRAGLVL